MTENEKVLTEKWETEPVTIKVAKKNNTMISTTEDLADLLSVSAITDFDNKVLFTKKKVEIINKNEEVILTGMKNENGLYIVDVEAVSDEAILTSKNENWHEWHRKLGHECYTDMNKLPEMCTGVPRELKNFKEDFTCEACIEAKMVRNPFNSERRRATRPLEIINCDLCGKVSPPTYNNKEYFMVCIDDYTHFEKAYLLEHKDEAEGFLQDYIQEAEAHFDKKVSVLRCDNGGEFKSGIFRNWWRKKGIEIDYTIPNSSPLNESGIPQKEKFMCQEILHQWVYQRIESRKKKKKFDTDMSGVERRDRTVSKWWKHFTRAKTGDFAVCQLCKKDIVRGGGTTNLKNHLKRNHFAEYFSLNNDHKRDAGQDRDADEEEDFDGEEVARITMSPGTASASSSPSPTPPPQSPSPSSSMLRSPSPLTSKKSTGTGRQPSISEFKIPDTKSAERLHMQVALFVSTTNMPLSLVEKEGFIRLCHALRPGYKPPGRKALTHNYIPKLYLGTKEAIEQKLAAAKWIALSSDTWTSVADDSYVGLSAHFIDNQWKLFAFTLNCRAFHEDHTGINLKEWFIDTLKDWNIKLPKVVSISIDNGDNIRLAVDLLGKPSMRCFGHTLQTGVTDIDGLKSVSQLKKASHKMLNFFSSTKVWNRYEAFVQKTYGVSPKVLPHPVKTRWWSELPLLRVLRDEESFHRGFLADYESGKHLSIRLSEADMRTLNLYLSTLEPIEELSTVLSADQYVTASAVLPVVYALEKMEERLKNLSASQGLNMDEDEDDSSSNENSGTNAEEMINLIVRKLHKRYSPSGAEKDAAEARIAGEQRENVRNCDVWGRETLYNVLVKCSYLDTRFRDDLTSDDRKCAVQQLLSEIEETQDVEKEQGGSFDGKRASTSTSESESPPPKKAKGIASIFSKITGGSGSAPEVDAEDELEVRLRKEMSKYEGISVAKDEDILAWWRLHENSFPLLASLAKKYLAIPATSTESERIFSYAGVVLNKLRSCLTGANAEKLIFIGMNKKFVPQI
ncbi:E3 SUMO-protein ligase ZBED1 [Frankliniella fusca]|uniref:E3 SUMO-protein ligase ZBED1 n=1 Tax=Frankliniella fusca TaxID=407009 RepID=A0AAE1HC95_9NEOP|nr:E3 SUMO-protein ligase ZBED1 [Frankliniella fusca]